MRLLGVIAVGTCCAIGATAYTYVNAQSGDPNMGRNAINYGVTQTAGIFGEAANVPANFVEEIKPGLQRLAQQGGTFLQQGGSAVAGTGRTDMVDPSQQAPAEGSP